MRPAIAFWPLASVSISNLPWNNPTTGKAVGRGRASSPSANVAKAVQDGHYGCRLMRPVTAVVVIVLLALILGAALIKLSQVS